MFNIGFSEMIILGILALLLIGPKQLPDLARTVGRFLNELKRTSSNFTEEFRKTTSFDEIMKPNQNNQNIQNTTTTEQDHQEKATEGDNESRKS
jgi:sec-independent protein translocase protein TatB